VELAPVGLWTFSLDLQPTPRVREVAQELEALGYRVLWLPEVAGRDPFVAAALLLDATSELVVATGIAGIYSRDALAAACAQRTLTEAFPHRFLLGLGVSHRPAVEGLRGQTYRAPLAAMRAYLDAMDAAPYFAVRPAEEPPRVLAALGPKMLALAAERSAGALTYLATPEHTASARAVMGPDASLYVEQMAVLETDPAAARAIARRTLAIYLPLANYANNLRRLGFTDGDLADGGSDRLVDAVFVWGDEAAIAARVADQRSAGADHVCVQVLPSEFGGLPLDEWRRLAPALLPDDGE
jgi:probable F420-dependent oxidoreductase